MSKRKTKQLTFFLWHRRIGLLVFMLVITLAITGIALNHTENFNLDKTRINNTWLLAWYGIEAQGEPVSFQVKKHIISAWQQQLFFDDIAITHLKQTIHGAIATEQFIVVALDNEIILLSYEGAIIERVSTDISFSNIQRLGKKYDRPVIETNDPLYYMADEHILDWDVTTNDDIVWTKEYKINSDERERLLTAYRGNGLKLERVLLDLHSGRIFGRYGIYLMDAAAIALLWLSLSGLWVWSSRRRKMRHKRHYQKHHRNPN